MADHIQKVAIFGVTGRIGSAFATELVKTGKHTVTGLTRVGSKSKVPNGVHAVQLDYDDEDAVVAALRGQEFVIITLSVMSPAGTHGKLVKAAVKAGVPYIMPNSYGWDPSNHALRDDIPRGVENWEQVQEVQTLGASYVVMCCGFWYQWSLALGNQWYGFDIKNRKVTFFDDGKTLITSSTWEQCGRALAAFLSLPKSGAKPSIEDYKNGALYLESFRCTQRDMLDSLHRVLGTTDADWEITYEPSEKRFKDGLQEMKDGNFLGFPKAMYSRAFFPSCDALLDSNKLSNQLLNLPKEDLDAATKDAAEWAEAGWNPFA